MIEATMTKCAVEPKDGWTILHCAFELADGEGAGATVRYDWFNEKFDHKAFIEELKEGIAKTLDLPPYRVTIDEKKLLKRMEHWAIKFAKMGYLINDGGHGSNLILPDSKGLLH